MGTLEKHAEHAVCLTDAWTVSANFLFCRAAVTSIASLPLPAKEVGGVKSAPFFPGSSSARLMLILSKLAPPPLFSVCIPVWWKQGRPSS